MTRRNARRWNPTARIATWGSKIISRGLSSSGDIRSVVIMFEFSFKIFEFLNDRQRRSWGRTAQLSSRMGRHPGL